MLNIIKSGVVSIYTATAISLMPLVAGACEQKAGCEVRDDADMPHIEAMNITSSATNGPHIP